MVCSSNLPTSATTCAHHNQQVSFDRFPHVCSSFNSTETFPSVELHKNMEIWQIPDEIHAQVSSQVNELVIVYFYFTVSVFPREKLMLKWLPRGRFYICFCRWWSWWSAKYQPPYSGFLRLSVFIQDKRERRPKWGAFWWCDTRRTRDSSLSVCLF